MVKEKLTLFLLEILKIVKTPKFLLNTKKIKDKKKT